MYVQIELQFVCNKSNKSEAVCILFIFYLDTPAFWPLKQNKQLQLIYSFCSTLLLCAPTLIYIVTFCSNFNQHCYCVLQL